MKFRQRRKVLRPEIIYGLKRNDPLYLRATRRHTFQNVLAPLLKSEATALGGRFVIDEESADIELQSFNLPLDAFRILRIGRIVDAVLDQQGVFPGYKEARAARV